MTHTASLAVSAVLLGLNGFFVLAEFAIVKVRSSQIEELISQGSLRAGLLKRIIANLDAYLSVIQLGITMASLGIGWMAEPALAKLLSPYIQRLPGGLGHITTHSLAFGIAFTLITFFHVVVGELAPKTIAIRRSKQAALFSAAPLVVFYRIFFVPMAILNTASTGLLKVLGFGHANDNDFDHSEDELKILLQHSQEKGELSMSRLLLFENLFDFGRTVVRDVMTPIATTAVLSLEKPWEANRSVVLEKKRSRYPLIGKDTSDIRGYVHIKDLWLKSQSEPDLVALRRDVPFLLETDRLEKAMLELRRKHVHLGIVRNRAGQITGIVTLEDLTEEIIGEVQDEFETPQPNVLSEALVPEAIHINLEAKDSQEALRIMVRKVVEVRPNVSYREAWEAVWSREKSLTSGVGRGVALPHGRLPGLDKPLLAFALAPKGVDFRSLDKSPVKLIFLILTPLREPLAQLRLLSKVAAFTSHGTSRRKLFRAQSTQEIVEIIQAFDQTVTE